MAKLFATETAAEVSFEAMRILGGNGYSKDFPVERYYRDAPLVVIGGGTNELQRLIIARNLLEKYKDTGMQRWNSAATTRNSSPARFIKHWPGRTITEYDNTWFALLSMNQNPLFIDEHYARAQPLGRRPVVDTLVFSLTVGMSVADTSGKTIANLGTKRGLSSGRCFRAIRCMRSPRCWKNGNPPASPTVASWHIETRGFNQNRERMIVLRRQLSGTQTRQPHERIHARAGRISRMRFQADSLARRCARSRPLFPARLSGVRHSRFARGIARPRAADDPAHGRCTAAPP